MSAGGVSLISCWEIIDRKVAMWGYSTGMEAEGS